jgi:hypothetical protein
MHANGIAPVIAVANDYRDYSLSVKKRADPEADTGR